MTVDPTLPRFFVEFDSCSCSCLIGKLTLLQIISIVFGDSPI